MKAALVALATAVLLHAPEALACCTVLDYANPLWDELAAGSVEDFNAMLLMSRHCL
jgi:hypothetical protein